MPMTHDEDEKDWKVYLCSLHPPPIPSDPSYLLSFELQPPPSSTSILSSPAHSVSRPLVSSRELWSPPSSIEKGLRKYVLYI
ncbi:hypothetical protein AFLA_004480 [Aspergillus flavus NRRL3357]|nr:hypothetical protein AFLA_004480 [Aspergillus flavus NRRL3357]